MYIAIFWDIASFSPYMNWHFGEYCFENLASYIMHVIFV